MSIIDKLKSELLERIEKHFSYGDKITADQIEKIKSECKNFLHELVYPGWICTDEQETQMTNTQAPCECLNWCVAEPQFGTNHHKNCKHYQSEVESRGKELFTTLINNFRDYCNEGDGIPEEMWENYKRCLLFLGMNDRFFKCLKAESND